MRRLRREKLSLSVWLQTHFFCSFQVNFCLWCALQGRKTVVNFKSRHSLSLSYTTYVFHSFLWKKRAHSSEKFSLFYCASWGSLVAHFHDWYNLNIWFPRVRRRFLPEGRRRPLLPRGHPPQEDQRRRDRHPWGRPLPPQQRVQGELKFLEQKRLCACQCIAKHFWETDLHLEKRSGINSLLRFLSCVHKNVIFLKHYIEKKSMRNPCALLYDFSRAML